MVRRPIVGLMDLRLMSLPRLVMDSRPRVLDAGPLAVTIRNGGLILKPVVAAYPILARRLADCPKIIQRQAGAADQRAVDPRQR
jgi:hypothetical protein